MQKGRRRLIVIDKNMIEKLRKVPSTGTRNWVHSALTKRRMLIAIDKKIVETLSRWKELVIDNKILKRLVDRKNFRDS